MHFRCLFFCNGLRRIFVSRTFHHRCRALKPSRLKTRLLEFVIQTFVLFSVTQICNNALINRGRLHTEGKVNIIINWLSSSAMPIEKLIRELHESKLVRQKKGVFENHASFVFYELLIFRH